MMSAILDRRPAAPRIVAAKSAKSVRLFALDHLRVGRQPPVRYRHRRRHGWLCSGSATSMLLTHRRS